VQADLIDAVNDVTPDDADADWKKRHDDADGNVPEHYGGSRFPHEVQNWRHILKRADPLAPCTATILGRIGGRYGRFTCTFRWLSFGGHNFLCTPLFGRWLDETGEAGQTFGLRKTLLTQSEAVASGYDAKKKRIVVPSQLLAVVEKDAVW
jgi:hypothetical protein